MTAIGMIDRRDAKETEREIDPETVTATENDETEAVSIGVSETMTT